MVQPSEWLQSEQVSGACESTQHAKDLAAKPGTQDEGGRRKPAPPSCPIHTHHTHIPIHTTSIHITNTHHTSIPHTQHKHMYIYHTHHSDSMHNTYTCTHITNIHHTHHKHPCKHMLTYHTHQKHIDTHHTHITYRYTTQCTHPQIY